MFLTLIHNELLRYADQKQALILQRFFKTGPGEYAEGDKFLGIKVPVLRGIARQHQDLSLKETENLLHSSFHEERLLALFILIFHFNKADSKKKEKIYRLYLKSTRYINNWDLVDVTAKFIVGAFLLDKNKGILSELAQSKDMWERRIAILSTFHFIEKGRFDDTLRIAKILLNDREDLIHKALGWMLREVGKRSLNTEECFLKKYYKVMPRTALRYAIERFPEKKRQAYLKGLV
jgi:3-methyladenine DNA glycosylase AlkD